MVTIADHYDAMTTHRSYQRPVPPREAIRRMQSVSGIDLHPEFLEYFVNYMGEYPVGSLLRLANAEIVLVTGFGSLGNQHLKVRRIFNARGALETELVSYELLPIDRDQIIGDIDPLARGIDISPYFDSPPC